MPEPASASYHSGKRHSAVPGVNRGMIAFGMIAEQRWRILLIPKDAAHSKEVKRLCIGQQDRPSRPRRNTRNTCVKSRGAATKLGESVRARVSLEADRNERQTTAQMKHLIATLLILCLATSLTGAEATSPPSPTRIRQLASAALAQLRADDLPQAMNSLGEAADLADSVSPEEDTGLAAAAAGLHRELRQQTAGARYKLLYEWTMPTESRRTVRVLTSLVPQVAPPKIFTRAIYERPRDNSFPISQINGVDGIFSTAWLLLHAAGECGWLGRLTNEFAALAAEDVPNAQYVLTLAEILQRRVDERLTRRLSQQAAAIDAGIPQPPGGPLPVDLKQVVTAAACLRDTSLVPFGERMLKSLTEYTYGGASLRMRGFLRLAYATAVRNRVAGTKSHVLDHPQLALWRSSQATSASLSSGGSVDALWLAHEDHVLHLAGPDNSLLFFRYPLTGEFEFSVETQDGGRAGTEGGLEYGGLGFEAWGSGGVFKARDADLQNHFERPSPFVPDSSRERFHRLAIKSTSNGFQVLSNGHPVWTDGSGNAASPWLALRSFQDRRPVFRNFKLTGNPTIPREVRMSSGKILRGWRAGYYGQQLPSPVAPPPLATLSKYEWFLHEGTIHGVNRSDSSTGQSRLEYARPLCDGESVSYEFHYAAGEFEVHPALGRLAFLIEPAGVRIHWMTAGDREWTSLPADNAVVEPLNRRGPKPLPLVEGDWNRVSIALADDKITLTLNGATIYERPLEAENTRTFSLYRDRTRSARIREVVMRGDWPERLSDEQLQNLVAVPADRTTAERHALHALVEERNIGSNVFAVRERASQLGKEARFRYLLGWVLPGENKPGFRLAGDFTPTNPPPRGRDEQTLHSDASRIQVGGDVVSPALDLIDLAKELKVLDKLRARVEEIEVGVDDSQQQRARVALLYLIDVARDDEEAAQADFGQLFDLFRESDHYLVSQRWPETLSLCRGVHYPPTREIVSEFLHLVNDMYSSDVRRWRTTALPMWHNHFFSLLGTHKYYQANQAARERFTAAPRLKNWSPVSLATSQTRGEGQPRPHWQWSDKQVDKLSGHHHFDYLMYRIPLRGNYEVECDLTLYGWRDTQLLIAGTWVTPHWDRMSYEIGTFRGQKQRRELKSKLGHTDPFVRVRAVVRDGVRTTYYDGRKLNEEPLPAEPDPWLAIRSWSRYHGAVRDVRIAGNPIIPDEVKLAALANMPGWISYFEDTVGPAGDWRHDGDNGIVGILKPQLAGLFKEGLLRYQRPMLEDGTIEYEFYYQPGQADVHPALDRLAFMLEPAGVRVHWATDGKYDRTGADPMNRFTEAANRRGPEQLPLKPMDWNRLRLTLRGDEVSLELNGQLIYQRVLEATNQRTFGLFHYADQTESRVRNIVWRGDWPRELPSLSEQELADNTDFLDQRVPELTAVFEHDFSRDGLPEDYFRIHGENVEQHISVESDGVRVVRPSGEEWARAIINPRVQARGDFDITATFEQLDTSAERLDAKTPLAASIDFLGALAGPENHHFTIIRREERDDRHTLRNHFALTQPSGSRKNFGGRRVSHADSGRFRAARRGDQIYFLFAEGDSPSYRLLGAETASTADTNAYGLRLAAEARGTGRVSVLWKEVSIRAEQLRHSRDPEPPVLFLMSTDGKEVRQLTKPIGDLGSHASPDWSPDGKRIAFDTFKGSTANAHIFLINPDGSDLEDLGLGSMPTFSPDGQRIAFSWSGRGVTVMDADGQNREILDPSGWGAQWSPDGKSIAYGSRNITVLDLATKRKRTILEGDQAQRYSFIYWNMSWSRDSSQICFKGRPRVGGKSEIAIANATGSSQGFQVLYSSESEPQTDFSWHPSNKQILCALPAPAYGGQRLFTLDAEKASPPELLTTQPLDQNNTGPAWSPDGKHIVFSSQAPPSWAKHFEIEKVLPQDQRGAR